MPDYWITIEHPSGKTLLPDGRAVDRYKIASADNDDAMHAAQKIVRTVANDDPSTFRGSYKGQPMTSAPFTLTITTKDPEAK